MGYYELVVENVIKATPLAKSFHCCCNPLFAPLAFSLLFRAKHGDWKGVLTRRHSVCERTDIRSIRERDSVPPRREKDWQL